MMKAVFLSFWMFLIAGTRSAAQNSGNSRLLLPQLLSCDKKPLNGQVRSITEKQNNSFYGEEWIAVSYTAYDEQARIKLLEHKLFGVRTYYRYHPDGQLQSTGSYFNSTLLDSTVYAYHDDGKMRATLHYGPDRSILSEVREIQYDSSGKAMMVAIRNVKFTEIEKVLGIGGDYIDIYWGTPGQHYQVFRYPYDPEKSCIIGYDRRIESVTGETAVEIFEGRAEKNRLFIQEYEYDEMGNWTACRYYNVKRGKKLRPRNVYLIRVREIEYR